MSLDVDLSIQQGDFSLQAGFHVPNGITALFGRSGSGKSSIINAIAGLISPHAGRVKLHEHVLFDAKNAINVPAHQRRMGCVFQDARLFPHLNVEQNLRFGLRFAPSREPGPSVDEICELLGLGSLRKRQPTDLSGGEKQRVALGRALLSRPKMLLMDEPLSALDAPRKDQIMPYLQQLKNETFALPILYVSHSIEEITQLADHLVILGEGKVAASGPIFDIMSEPKHLPLFGKRQGGAIIRAKVMSHAKDGISQLQLKGGEIELPGLKAPIGSELRLQILAQDIILARTRPQELSSLNILPVSICAIHPDSEANAVVSLSAAGEHLLARVTKRALNDLQLHVGSDCFAVFKATSLTTSSNAN